MTIDLILNKFRATGVRVTTARKNISKIIVNSTSPISANDINTQLEARAININKTTIYRELKFLIDKQIIKQIDFGEGIKRYEMSNLDHHHHLVCLKCKNTFDISIEEDIINVDQITLQKDLEFKVFYHSLEFFGECKGCQKKL